MVRQRRRDAESQACFDLLGLLRLSVNFELLIEDDKCPKACLQDDDASAPNLMRQIHAMHDDVLAWAEVRHR